MKLICKKRISDLIENTYAIISEMKTTLIIKKNTLLIRLAHRLDGSSKTIGARNFPNTANNIYKCSKLMNKNEILIQIEELIKVFQETELNLMAYME